MHVMRLCKFVRIYPKAAHDAYFPAGLLTRLDLANVLAAMLSVLGSLFLKNIVYEKLEKCYSYVTYTIVFSFTHAILLKNKSQYRTIRSILEKKLIRKSREILQYTLHIL